MPNLDFYACDEDLQTVLSKVFALDGVRVFESCSPLGAELAEFRTADEIRKRYRLGECVGEAPAVLLQLWPVNASSDVRIRRVECDPIECNGATYHFCIEGWGLIQLYLGGRSSSGLVPSHTNHNSEKRASAWATIYERELGDPGRWNWKEVTRVSRALNAQIRKLAVEKRGSRPVLPAASALIQQGLTALP